eukprot:2784548-Amphidinium_carterae.1
MHWRNAAQEVKLQNLHASPRAQLPMLNFVATEGMAAAFHSCSQEAAGIRTKLLMEQADVGLQHKVGYRDTARLVILKEIRRIRSCALAPHALD